MAQYYGRAGIFSTDDLAADRQQIEAEQGPEDFGDEHELAGVQCDGCGNDLYECTCPFDEFEQATCVWVVATCPGNPNWYDFQERVLRDNDAILRVIRKFYEAHEKKCGCKRKLSIQLVEI